ncbi:rCG22993, isoform CRA_c [Rattus norvegicus]|uniref:RCG22993, isoform CRA_c n=1 Tax=Rattus norvegicus TaxID=10116 RepID=A6KBB7_RAT|nr:rCG22993, isoform CRA_c [Rattus norvegicus]
MVNGLFSITGYINIQKCGCGLLQGGMGISRLFSKSSIHGCNVGELQQSSFCRISEVDLAQRGTQLKDRQHTIEYMFLLKDSCRGPKKSSDLLELKGHIVWRQLRDAKNCIQVSLR